MVNWSGADYGRNKNNAKLLKEAFYNDFTKILNVIKGSKLTDVKKIIKYNWTGADCDDFIKDLDNKIASISEQMMKITGTINNAIDSDYNEFLKFQSNNVK